MAPTELPEHGSGSTSVLSSRSHLRTRHSYSRCRSNNDETLAPPTCARTHARQTTPADTLRSMDLQPGYGTPRLLTCS
eukprot:12189359-Alexandrium_andersonii.AAC.1